MTDAERRLLDMDLTFMVLILLLWNSDLRAEENHSLRESVRFVGGASRCSGTLELKHDGEWRVVTTSNYSWSIRPAAAVCTALDCGPVIFKEDKTFSSEYQYVWRVRPECIQSGSALKECVASEISTEGLHINCSDSVRLVTRDNPCSGWLEVRFNQSDQYNQTWSSVCEDGFDQQDAEVVCREIGCGSPKPDMIYEKLGAPVWAREFQCGGNESSLLDCGSSDRNTCSPGRVVGLTCSEPVELRLVGGASPCAGSLEVKHAGEWRRVFYDMATLKEAAVICREMDCGSPVSVRQRASYGALWSIHSYCLLTGGAVRGCLSASGGSATWDLVCTDSVRLVNGNSRCSGILEVKPTTWHDIWSSVCTGDFDQQNAEVVCRELDCGPPSVIQGVRYDEVEASVSTTQFRCEGHESSLRDCRNSDLFRSYCYGGDPVKLTCSEPDIVRLVGGANRCAGTLEVKLGEWRATQDDSWTLREAAVICRMLDCGSAVFTETKQTSNRPLWWIRSDCIRSGSAPDDCVSPSDGSNVLHITCSDSVRLVNGSSPCSGRLEVKSDQSNQRWSSVCEADFDQQDAEVVCRELNCGPPSVLQGAFYGDEEAPVWTREFQCEGHESALLDCRSSGSVRNTCSPGGAVGLTCSEPVRLVGGASRCTGALEVKQGQWEPVNMYNMNLKVAGAVCKVLDCGPAISTVRKTSEKATWRADSHCVESGLGLKTCIYYEALSTFSEPMFQHITCLDSVRLVNGSSPCSGRLEVKSDQSNQTWSSVCEADFDQQDAEVVCRELNCGPPSVLQGALYGDEEAPVWTREFQCEGHESALLDCRSSGSVRNTCSPGGAVGLTCSEPVRLVGGASRCGGTLEVKQGQWEPVDSFYWSKEETASACRELDCGSAVSADSRFAEGGESWKIKSTCVQSGSSLKECMIPEISYDVLQITCSDSVRLVNGSSPCSGRLEVKSDQSNQRWSSVCEADFDQQDAEVVCRELNCGPPSVLQGALYGDEEAPVWTREFQCEGHESALLDCRSSGSVRNTCSPGGAVGLTCSEPADVRLVGGASRCTGTLEVKQGVWRPVSDLNQDWTMKEAGMVCSQLYCGSAVSFSWQQVESKSVWMVSSACVQFGSPLSKCAIRSTSTQILGLNCSEPESKSKRSTDQKSQHKVSVFTPVFIFTLVLLVPSLVFFIYAIVVSLKTTRGQQSEQVTDPKLELQQ